MDLAKILKGANLPRLVALLLFGAVVVGVVVLRAGSATGQDMMSSQDEMADPSPASAPYQLPEPLLPPPPEASADEPFAETLSPQKAAEYLDAIALNWSHQRNCGTCHTNYAYMMGRPSLGTSSDPAVEDQVRSFFQNRVVQRLSRPPLPHSAVMAAVLAINDSEHGNGLHPVTREALDRAWELQSGDGGWEYPEIFYSPPLGDFWWGAAMVAIGVGVAPDNYADTPAARVGMAKLKGFLARNPAPTLHHRTMLLWASLKTPGLMTDAEQQATIDALLARQRSDGGWSLRSLGDWNRRDGSPNDPEAESDGYATGLIVYVLRQAGYTPNEQPVSSGVRWLKENQRASGRWFTRSINIDSKGHFISNIGTAYAVMALRSAGALNVDSN